LRRGNATIFSGVDDSEIEDVLAIIRTECRARTELVPAQTLPFPGTTLPTGPEEVRVGGAIVFIVPVERFEKT